MEELSKKQVRLIIEGLGDYYGIKNLKMDFIFLKDGKNKVHLINKEYKLLNHARINEAGLYFINISKDLRLSIEGAQIIGRLATKNIYDLSDEDLTDWLRGFDIETGDNHQGYKLMKNNDDFYGVGYFKDNKIRNFIPKSRRIK